MDFYERIKTRCKEQGISVRELIESVGMNYDSYNGLKRYDNYPRLDEAMKIAEKLNTTVGFLMTGNNVELSESEFAFIEVFRKIPDNLKLWVIESLENLVNKI